MTFNSLLGPTHRPVTILPCPQAGGGVHRWLLAQANRCRNAGLQPEQTFKCLREGSRNCGRFVGEAEITSSIRTAYSGSPWTQSTPRNSVQPHYTSWPPADQHAIATISTQGPGLEEFESHSPVKIQENAKTTETVVDTIFPGNPLICVAHRKPSEAATAPRNRWRGRLSDFSLIVPSPMTSTTGTTKEGKVSPRCLSNVGPRRFLVIEFDNGDLDSQAARLWELACRSPLSLAVHSGNKSIHGWFYCDGIPEEGLRNFMNRCVLLGADPATWIRCQMVRMPGGMRDNGRPQRVLFFNPTTLQ